MCAVQGHARPRQARRNRAMSVQPWHTTTDQRATIFTRGCRPVAPIARPARDMKRHHRAAASSGAVQHRATSGDLRTATMREGGAQRPAAMRDKRACNRANLSAKAKRRAPPHTAAAGDQVPKLSFDFDLKNSIGYLRMSASGESSTTMHRLLHASRSHPIPPPDDPK
ncbi:putative serine/threonine-protein kinase-like [Dorcoceras hygrometricum]|uniref:Putative serine/threonine-protein kinase-like n=1 Tax=Dorcoceras hygrometricum TaxID=472368 RepID=A0A2Z7CUU1_9LAMI|nr:putative serine/threonine-protein kinase-like [Dorcoceras hygrometricum]